MRVWPRLQVLSEAAHGTLHCRFAHEAACAMGCALQRMPACARSPAHCMPPWEQSPPARVSAGRGSGALSPPCTARSASSSAASTRAAATCASACRAGGGCRAWARCASCSLCRSSKAAWARRARTATRRSAAACLAAAATWCWRRRRVRGPPAAPALPRASPATGEPHSETWRQPITLLLVGSSCVLPVALRTADPEDASGLLLRWAAQRRAGWRPRRLRRALLPARSLQRSQRWAASVPVAGADCVGPAARSHAGDPLWRVLLCGNAVGCRSRAVRA